MMAHPTQWVVSSDDYDWSTAENLKFENKSSTEEWMFMLHYIIMEALHDIIIGE